MVPFGGVMMGVFCLVFSPRSRGWLLTEQARPAARTACLDGGCRRAEIMKRLHRRRGDSSTVGHLPSPSRAVWARELLTTALPIQ